MRKISTLLLLLFCLGIQIGNAQVWETMGSGLGVSSESVKAIATDPNGNVYVGGTFTGTYNHLAKWNGTSWSDVGGGVNGDVFAIGIKTASEIYIGGLFTDAGGVAVHNIARWTGSVFLDVNGGFNDQVNVIYTPGSGDVYAGGKFSQSGTNTMMHISKLVSGTWTQMGTGITSVVNAITLHSNVLYAGSENAAGPVHKFDGSSWSGVSGLSGGKVYALASFGGYLYAGGDFTSPARAAAKFDGTSWGTITTTFTSTTDKIYALFVRSTILYIGGKYSLIGIPGSQSANISKITSSVTPLQTITLTSSTIGGDVYAIGNRNGKVIAGGTFASPATNIAWTSTTIDVNEISDLVVDKNFYPNPVHGIAKLTLTTKERLKNVDIKVFDIQSKLMADLNVEKIENNNEIEFKIDCNNLPAGNYYYMVTEGGQNILSDNFIVE